MLKKALDETEKYLESINTEYSRRMSMVNNSEAKASLGEKF
jgi:hypothetical protein